MPEHPDIVRVRVYPDIKSKYRWTAYAANGEEVAISSEGYAAVEHCTEAARSLFPHARLDISEITSAE